MHAQTRTALSRLRLASCQEILTAINLYANPNDTDNPFTRQSEMLTLYPNSSGSENSACMSNSFGIGDWPTTSQGKYEVWVDASVVSAGCQLRFYDAPESDDDWRKDANKYCQGLTYIVTGKVSTAYVELENEFGVSYCCGDACNEADISKWTRDVHDDPLEAYELPRALGATEDYGPPPLEARRERCNFDAAGDNITTYGYAQTLDSKMACSSQASTPCLHSMTYSTSSEESSETKNTTVWSVEYTLGLAPGTEGCATFQPKYKCAQGNFTGHCGNTYSLADYSDWKCVNAYIQSGSSNIEPEGIWRMVMEV